MNSKNMKICAGCGHIVSNRKDKLYIRKLGEVVIVHEECKKTLLQQKKYKTKCEHKDCSVCWCHCYTIKQGRRPVGRRGEADSFPYYVQRMFICEKHLILYEI